MFAPELFLKCWTFNVACAEHKSVKNTVAQIVNHLLLLSLFFYFAASLLALSH